MSPGRLNEQHVEEAALAWLADSGFSVAHGPEIAVGQPGAERSDPTYRDVVLEWRLREALVRLNPDLPQEALDHAFRKIVRADGPSLIERNRAVHKMLVNGVTVEYHRPGEPIRGAQARVMDFDDPDNNDWLAVNQFTVVGPQGHNRRADIVIFVNGLPLGVIELKNPADEKATIGGALNQLQTYQSQIPALFDYNCALVVSDGTEARIGVLGAGKEWFKPWRTIDGRGDAPKGMPELQVVLEGVFERRRFLDLIRYFIVFEDEGGGKLTKKMAGYHQFHAVNFAVEQTLRAAGRKRLRAGEPEGRYESGRQPAASSATGASASSGTPRVRARA
jgi:type I restriction enzyme R subunit